MKNFYYDYENQIDEGYDVDMGIIDYGDGNIKKCAPSLDDYDGNEGQQY